MFNYLIKQEDKILGVLTTKNVKSSYSYIYKTFVKPQFDENDSCYDYLIRNNSTDVGGSFLFEIQIPDETEVIIEIEYELVKVYNDDTKPLNIPKI